ncbi:MAG: hypothetical protein ACRD96_23420 [Bryobacteraceae bacterium]
MMEQGTSRQEVVLALYRATTKNLLTADQFSNQFVKLTPVERRELLERLESHVMTPPVMAYTSKAS